MQCAKKRVLATTVCRRYVDMAPPEQELPVNAMRVGLDAPLSREGVEHPFGEEAAL